MIETEVAHFAERTRRNVRESDATLILTRGPCEGGTLFTLELAGEAHKPHLVVDFAETAAEDAVRRIVQWLTTMAPGKLNVAGPRSSKDPAIYRDAKAILAAAFWNLANRS